MITKKTNLIYIYLLALEEIEEIFLIFKVFSITVSEIEMIGQ